MPLNTLLFPEAVKLREDRLGKLMAEIAEEPAEHAILIALKRDIIKANEMDRYLLVDWPKDYPGYDRDNYNNVIVYLENKGYGVRSWVGKRGHTYYTGTKITW